jgi:hypothetical protein
MKNPRRIGGFIIKRVSNHLTQPLTSAMSAKGKSSYMSHVTKMNLIITNLDALKQAAGELGLYFREQDTYRWYGHFVGDYPLPAGFAKEDLGKCTYAMGIEGDKHAYEVGVVKRKDGKGWDMMHDFYMGGYGLVDVIGDDGTNLKTGYTKTLTVNEARKNGFRVKERRNEHNQVELTLFK